MFVWKNTNHSPMLLSRSSRLVCLSQSRSFSNLSKITNAIKSSSSPSAQSYSIHKSYPYSQALMYQLISEVDKYHEFIPYCVDSFVKERDLKGQPSVAGLGVGFKKFEEEFTCTLECEKPSLVIAKSITHSLFYNLYTRWDIEPVDKTHCKTKLTLEYEFKNEIYNQVSKLFAQHVTNLMTKAFEKRAYEITRI